MGVENKVNPIFRGPVKTVQQNVHLREDRRYYGFLADYDIGQMLLLLGEKLRLNKPEDIFNMSWKEIKKLGRK